MYMHDRPVAWTAFVWEEDTLRRFKAQVGDPSFQSLWEILTLLMCVVLWVVPDATESTQVCGDNIGALADALRMKGKGLMAVVAREFAWRKALMHWRLEFSHLPSELNVRADALSRLYAPEPASFPSDLKGVSQAGAPTQAPEFWRAWLEDPPPKIRRR